VGEQRADVSTAAVGEFVSTREEGPLYHVIAVVHCPHGEDYCAEVFAEEAGTLADIIAAGHFACRGDGGGALRLNSVEQ